MMRTPLRKAVEYARVSSRPQEMTASREVQFDRMDNYARWEGLPVARRFEDVGSGLSTKERPQFEAFVAFACDPANGITDAIVDDLSRFTRSPRDYYPYMERLEKAGITLHSALEGAKVGPDSDFTWGMICLTNERNSRLQSAKTKNHQREAVKRGQIIAGKAPYGYMWERVDREIETSRGKKVIAQNRLVPNPEEWPHLLKIFTLALNGKSPLTIAKELNSLSIPGPTDGEWSDRAVRYILRNPHYLGRPYRGKNPKSKLPGRQESMPITYGEDTHEAAVSQENFEKIDQMILARTYTSGPTKCHSSPSIVSGIAKCGPCIMAGYPPQTCNLVVARDHKGGTARLRCSRKKNQKKHACSTKKNIRLDTLLKHVMTRMFDHNLTGQNIKELIEEVTRKSNPYLEDKQKEKEDLYKSLAEVRKRIQNISEVIQTQGTRYQGMPTMLEDLAKLEKKRQTLEENIQEINDATEEARLFIDEEAAKELIRLFVTSIDVYDIQPLTKGDQEWRLDIQWTLPIFSERTDKSGDREIVILKKDDDDHQDDDFCLLGRFVGINLPKRQVFVDSFYFEEPNRRGTHKKSTTPSRATTKKPKANRKKAMPQPAAQPRKPKPKKQKPRKAPTPKRTPEEQREARRLHEQARNRTPERREYRRRYAEEQRQMARLLGRCQNCSKPTIPGLSRCEICAEAHRQSCRRSDANRRAANKETRLT